MKRFTLFVCLLALPALAFGQMKQASCGNTAKASGLWSSGTTWTPSVPSSGCGGTIADSLTVTVDIGNAVSYYLSLGDAPPYADSGFGILKFNNSSQLTVYGTFRWGTGTAADSGTIDMTSGGKLILKGSVTVTAAQAHLYAGTGTIQFDSSFAQTIPAGTYNNLTLSGSGTKTAGGNITVGGDLINSATLDMAGYTLSVAGTTTNTGGTIRFSGASNGLAIGTGTVEYYGSTQTVKSGTYNYLYLSGSGMSPLDGSISVGGTLTVGSSAELSPTSGQTIDGAGTLTGTGLVHVTATGNIDDFASQYTIANKTLTLLVVQLDGASAQQTGGTFGYVGINNSSNVILVGTMTVNTTLFFSSGNLILGSNNLILGGSVGGATEARHVVTDGAGVVMKSVPNTTAFTFPIGPSATTYNPVTLTNNTGTTDTYTARVEVGDNPTTPDNTQAGNQTWTLTGTATGGLGVGLAFTWLTSEAGVNVTPSSAVGWVNNGIAWVQGGGTTVTGTPNVTTVSGNGLISPWIIGNPNALPVELASFTANAVANNVNLEWSTISETNTYGFYVERSSSKTGPFTAVSSLIAGAGTSLELHNYSYADNNVTSGTYYYRVHEVDKNGKGTYSSVITVTVANVLGVREDGGIPTEFKVQQNYPNPFNPSTVIKFSVEKAEHAALTAYNMMGQEVAKLFDGVAEPGHYYRAQFDGSRLPSGLYYYRLVTDSRTDVKKLLLLK